MKTASCIILAMFALATVNVSSETVHGLEITSIQARTRARPYGLSLTQGRKVMVLDEGPYADSSVRLGGLISEHSQHAEDAGGSSSCITAEMCRKKKVICYRKCTDSSGNEVDEKHFPGAKCIVKCKKCVPNC